MTVRCHKCREVIAIANNHPDVRTLELIVKLHKCNAVTRERDETPPPALGDTET